METLSSTSIKHGGSSSILFSSTSRDSISLLKPSPKTQILYTKPKTLNLEPKHNHVHVQASSLPKTRTFLSSSNRAETGYAGALANATCQAGTLSEAYFDARRILLLVRGVILDPTLDEIDKAIKIIKGIQRGGFEKHVGVLIKLLVKKGKIGLIEEVMKEFSRIYGEITGTKIVMC